MRQRAPFGRNFNFFGKRGDEDRSYNYDRSHFGLKVRGIGRPPFGKQWRYGYHQRKGFRDIDFLFRFWVFSPFVAASYPSPWYGYPGLPPYVDANRVVVISPAPFRWDDGSIYDYYPQQAYNAYGDGELNQALSDIEAIFDEKDRQAIENLSPSNIDVAIYNNDQYMYSMNGSDFQQMMLDNAYNTQTRSFEITSVRTTDGYASVRCTHRFVDADGASHTVYQLYRLHRIEDDGYVITDFMTSED